MSGQPTVTDKIYKINPLCVFSGSGDGYHIRLTADWLRDTTAPKPTVTDMGGIVVRATPTGDGHAILRAYFIQESLIERESNEAFCAMGSGRDFALAAMHLHKSAADAVLIASLFDVYCGNGFNEAYWSGDEFRIK
jgi:hypothetical protein